VRGVAVAAALGLLAWGVAKWDQRSEWQRFVERGLEVPAAELPFAGQLPPGASVFLDDSLLASWMLLHRADYYAREQGSGLLFNRRTSLEFERRSAQFAPLAAGREMCTMMAAVAEGTQSALKASECDAPGIEAIREMCALPQGPQYLIFRADDAQHATARWTFRPEDAALRKTYSLYDCAALH
jgi:hypothetical protein